MSENFIKNLPPKFVRNVLDLCGNLGEEWLNDLPQIIEKLSFEWNFQAEKPFENLSYNYVAPCKFLDGKESILKIALPLNNPEIYNEAKYLQIQNGRGAVKILNFNKMRRAILLEKLNPGKHLKEIFQGNEKRAVEIAADLTNKLKRKPPVNSDFLLLENWFENFFKRARYTEFPQEYRKNVQEIFYQLNNSSQKFLLHGDLHHENILFAGNELFLVIDPKGIIGEVGFETAAFLNNHANWLAEKPNLQEILTEAVAVFSGKLKIAPKELYQWAYTQMILSVWWTFEDGGKNWREEFWRIKTWETLMEKNNIKFRFKS